MPTLSWYNSDGLYIKYGITEGAVTTGGEFMGEYDGFHVVSVTIPAMTALATTEAIIADDVVIPAGARLWKVEIIAETACGSSGSATLDVGLIRTDRTTAYDDDGLIAALALTSIDAAGETNTLTPGVTSAGALLGTTLANNGLITASYNVAAFNAGKVQIRVFYYMP